MIVCVDWNVLKSMDDKTEILMTSEPQIRRIPVGISSCLLGEQVRYDGGHKHARYCSQVLSRYFEFRSLCPELEAGLGVPRPAIHLRRHQDALRLITTKGMRTTPRPCRTGFNRPCPTWETCEATSSRPNRRAAAWNASASTTRRATSLPGTAAAVRGRPYQGLPGAASGRKAA